MKKIALIVILFTSFLITGCSNENQKTKNSHDSKIEVTKNDPKEVEKILTSDSHQKYTNQNFINEEGKSFNQEEPLELLLQTYSWANDSFIFTFTNEGTIIAHTFQNRRNNVKTDDYGTYSVEGTDLKIHINNTSHNPNIINDYTYTITQTTKNTIQLKDLSKNPQVNLNLTCVSKL